MTAAKKAAASETPVETPVETPEAPTEEPKAAKKKGATYRVTAPLIAVTLGSQVFQYAAGDVLPNGVDQDTLDRLTARGFIAEA